MAKKKSNYLIMLDLGEWLELYLNPNIKPWQYKKLAADAIEILNLDFKISENDLTLQCINRIESQPPKTKEWYANIVNVTLFDGDDPCNIMVLINAAAKGIKPGPLSSHREQWIRENKFRVLHIYLARLIISNLLKTIVNSDRPWAYSIEEAINSGSNAPSYESFMNHYSEISDTLIIEGGEAKTILKFQNSLDHIINHPSAPTAFPWIIVTSRIFFDFFMRGGQEYCTFCEQCGRLIVSQRKNRRKTCSDSCRQEIFKKHHLS